MDKFPTWKSVCHETYLKLIWMMYALRLFQQIIYKLYIILEWSLYLSSQISMTIYACDILSPTVCILLLNHPLCRPDASKQVLENARFISIFNRYLSAHHRPFWHLVFFLLFSGWYLYCILSTTKCQAVLNK